MKSNKGFHGKWYRARLYLKNPSFGYPPDYAPFENFFTTDRGRRRPELAPKRRLPSHEIGEVALGKRALARDSFDKRENARFHDVQQIQIKCHNGILPIFNKYLNKYLAFAIAFKLISERKEFRMFKFQR